MRKNLKKTLIVLSAGIFFLSDNVGLVNHCVLAGNDPPVSFSKSLGENEFEGDDGSVYELRELVGRGNQSMAFRCADRSGVLYIVKIPLNSFNTFLDKASEGDTDSVKKEALRILRESIKCVMDFSTESGTFLAPPPTPRKKKTTAAKRPKLSSNSQEESSQDVCTAPQRKKMRLPLCPMRKLNFDDTESSCTTTVHGVGDDSFLSPVDDEEDCLCLPIGRRTPILLNREHVTEPLTSSVVAKSAGSHSAASTLASPTSEALASLPKPDKSFMHYTVMDRPAAAILKEGAPYTVRIFSNMPHIEEHLDQTLMQRLTRNQFPQTLHEFIVWSKGILSNVLTALVHFHRHGLYHRDINPTNIFVNRSEQGIVGDLGSTCIYNVAMGKPVGTLGYMAPEVFFECDRRDPDKADTFSFGMTALELLTGFDAKKYFNMNKGKISAENIKSIIYSLKWRVKNENGEEISVPASWKNFLYYCVTPNYQERMTSAIALEELSKL